MFFYAPAGEGHSDLNLGMSMTSFVKIVSVPTKADFLPSADADCTVKQQTVAIGRSRSSCRMPYLLSNLPSNTVGSAVT